MRSTGEDNGIGEEKPLTPSKKLDLHYRNLGKTEFYTTCNPDEVEMKLALILKNDEIEPKICSKKYKVTFTKDEVMIKV